MARRALPVLDSCAPRVYAMRMTSKKYLWQRQWSIDAGQRLAVHASGLRVPFTPAGDTGAAENAPQIQAALAVKNGPHNAPVMVRRLEREARQFVREHFDGRR
jgi:hypothetical protein